MATLSSSPQPQSPDDEHIPTATLALPSIATASVSRRLPPPCWSPEETVALIDSYRDKWYSLHRGNLRANHWQEVADDVANRCPVTPAKTAVQCRHKMEKLRKRYRSELQRSAGLRRFISTWPHFQSMHAMDKGPNANRAVSSSSEEEEDVDVRRRGSVSVNEAAGYGYGNSVGVSSQKFGGGGVGGGGYGNGGVPTGVRIKIPGRMPSGSANSGGYGGYDEMGMGSGVNVNSNPYARFANNSVPGGYGSGAGGSSSKVVRDRFAGRGEMGSRMVEVAPKRKSGDGGMSEVVASIQALGEGFMRIEKVKMDMARQVEEMRMEMELKRTEMILGSQQRIVEAFAKALGERSSKKAKKMHGSP